MSRITQIRAACKFLGKGEDQKLLGFLWGERIKSLRNFGLWFCFELSLEMNCQSVQFIEEKCMPAAWAPHWETKTSFWNTFHKLLHLCPEIFWLRLDGENRSGGCFLTPWVLTPFESLWNADLIFLGVCVSGFLYIDKNKAINGY